MWDDCSSHDSHSLERIQLSVACSALSLHSHSSALTLPKMSLLRTLGWPTLAWRQRRSKLLLFWQLVHGLGPPCLQDKLSSASSRCKYSLRNPNLWKSLYAPPLPICLPSCLLAQSFGTLFLPLSHLALHCLHLPLLLTLSSWMTSFLTASHLNYSQLVLLVFFSFFCFFFSSTLSFLFSVFPFSQRKTP